MKAIKPSGELVEVTQKTYDLLYKARGWKLVKESTNLDKLKKSELQKIAGNKGISYKSDTTKEELIKLIDG
ncbi:Uncharacterised protein [Anaerococcus prevotii]|uniref:Rho termination factor N-terminal domain-containing protein n=1 Tax=Anaerococcus prevotii (strain ATCC 9321 / DSM 20548 / JCM 6508 / NCTC 11806 / PC1) TaxID=525919 RepID=C7RHA8_ANAPD|nr:hypothetical protein [Anaerococcus prevotii]ACV28869.1 hypothetical protein Apre_0841 [Anaerococcus prevotii DSM 20548]SUU94542.1 Uncharacterised protein [Anaerococcus prevotii]